MAERKAPARKATKAAAPEPTKKPEPAPEPEVEKPEPSVTDAPVESPGFVGDHTDPTPNEHYTLAGVIAGKPVPGHDR